MFLLVDRRRSCLRRCRPCIAMLGHIHGVRFSSCISLVSANPAAVADIIALVAASDAVVGKAGVGTASD